MMSHFSQVPEELILEIFGHLRDLPDIYNFSLFINSIKGKYYINDDKWCKYLIDLVLKLDIENKCQIFVNDGDWPHVYLELISRQFEMTEFDMPPLLPSGGPIFKIGKEPSGRSEDTYNDTYNYRNYIYDEFRHTIYHDQDSLDLFKYKIILLFNDRLKKYQFKVTRSYFTNLFKNTEYYENKVNILKESLKLLSKYFELSIK